MYINYNKLLSEKNKSIYLVVFILCIILVSFIGKKQYNWDIYFIYNRVVQMSNCIKDKNIPYFYYNDFNNMGYGSSFFYGHLFLYLFIPIIKYGFSCFAISYHTFSMIIYITGIVFLFKTITKDWKFGSFLYMSCSLILYTLTYIWMYGMILGQGLSLFFFAFCIRFFRDRKSFKLASLFFFFILNTHMLTALVSFLVCICLMFYYFDKNRIKDYICFALCTLILCNYNICNYIYHSDILNRIGNINLRFSNELHNPNRLYYDIFLGFISTILRDLFQLSNAKSTVILNLPFFILLLYSIFYMKNRKIKIFAILSLFICIISIGNIFYNINLNVIFQFPIRYLYVVCIVFCVCILKYKNKLKYILYPIGFLELYLCLMCYMFSLNDYTMTDEMVYEELSEFNNAQVINGEFLDKSFDLKNLEDLKYDATHVFDKNSKKEFKYWEKKEKLYVEIDTEEELELQFPKIYYRGYKLYNDKGEEYELRKGYSQFITANISNYTGRLTLVYEHPNWLKFIGLCCYSFALGIIIYSIVYLIRKRKLA